MKIQSLLKGVRAAFVGALTAVPVIGLAYSSRSYVRPDHLIAQWDGIENAGRYTHDANAAYPVELVKGLSQDLSGTIAASDRCFELGKGYLHFVSSDIAAAVNEGHATVELVIAMNGSYCHNGGFVAFGKTTRGFWAYQQSGAFLNSYSYHATASGQYADIGYNADGTNTVAFVLGATTDESAWYENGTWKNDLTRHSTDCDGDCYIGTIAASWVNTKANAKVFAIRVYDTVLTAEELAANRAVDEARFIQGCGIDELLEITGLPDAYGDVKPAYGFVPDLSLGAEIPCEAPSVWTNADKTVVAECVGYKLYAVDGATGERRCVDEQPETSFVYKHPGEQRVLEWQWQSRIELQAGTEAGGTVELSDRWAGIGDEITLTATPDAGWSFAYWDGDVPAELRHEPHPTFALTLGMVSFRAVFRRDCYVAADGDDGNDGTSWATAYKTLKRALASHVSVNVNVGPGLFDTDEMLIVSCASAVTGSAGPSGEPTSVVRMTKQIGAAFLVSNEWSSVSHLAMTAQGNHYGRGVWLWGGGLVEDCVITNCVSDKCSTLFGSAFNNVGGGVLLYGGGTVRNCLIANCSSTSGSGWHPGGGIGILKAGAMTGGLVENCVVTNCFTSYTKGGGVYAEAGVVRNTLIAGNTLKTSATGATNLHLTDATAENCTIAGGFCDLSTAVPAVSMDGTARLANSIVYGNRSIATVAGIQTSGKQTVVTHCCTETETPGDGNVVADPQFADAAHGDYSIGFSACVDAGLPLSWHAGATDLGGRNRVMGSAVDMGCYEYEPEAVIVTAQSDGAVDRAAVTFSAVINATGKATESFRWTVFGADGSELTTNGQHLASFTVTLGAGLYGAELTVTVGGEEETCRKEGLVAVSPSVLYVSSDGANVPPYADVAHGCTDLHAAVEFVGANGKVLIAPGYYTLADTLYLARPVRLIGLKGEEAATLYAIPTLKTEPMVSLAHAEAWLEGVTVSGYSATGEQPLLQSCGIRIASAGGTVTNCVVDGVRGADGGPGIQQAGGLVVDTVIRNNLAPATGYTKYGGGVNVSGGLMTRCVITNNVTTYVTSSMGGGAYVSGGTLENSFVCGNECSGLAGGVYCAGGTVRNCLISGNLAWMAAAGAQITGKGEFYNNTLVGNGRTHEDGDLNAALRVDDAKALAKNNIVWDNRDCAVALSVVDGANKVSNNCTEDPRFRRVRAMSYDIGSSSPAYGSGDPSVWQDETAPVDLACQPRLRHRNRVVDAGCYASSSKPGLSVLVR